MTPRESEAPDEASAPSRREQRRLETRARILEAALDEFRAVGVASAQIDRIVERAGVARGTFYFHFPTKEHVLLAAQQISEGEVVERLRALGPLPDSVPEFLRRVLEVIMAGFDDDRALRREILAMYVRRPDPGVQIQLSGQPLIVEVVDYMAEAAERGAVRTDIAPEELAIRFLGSFFHLLMGDVRTRDDDEADDPFTNAIEIFMHGIAAK